MNQIKEDLHTYKPLSKKNLEWVKSEKLNIIPLIYRDKKPSEEWKKWQDTKITDEEIKKYFLDKEQPHNVGCVCGDISDNLFVLDFDTEQVFQDFFPEDKGLVIAKTGRGRHVYFKSNEPVKPLKCFDERGREILTLKSTGGYVVFPPSIHPNGKQYEFEQRGKIPRLKGDVREVVKKRALKIGLNFGAGEGNSETIDIEYLLKGVPHGGQDNAILMISTYLRRQGASLEEALGILGTWNKNNDPVIPESEIRDKCGTHYRRREAYGYYFKTNPTTVSIKEDLTLEKEAEPAKQKKGEGEAVQTYEDVDIKKLLDVFRKWMYIANPWDITIPVAYAMSNFTKADPGCLAIIAPSGSYKTELIRSLGEQKNEFVYPLNNFTSHTFISGMPKVPDVVDDLDKRLILVQDFTTVLSKAQDESRAIFTNIREVLNGFMDGHFGSGKNVEYRGIHSSFLIASTDELEAAYSLNAVLGQRMMFFKPRNDPKMAMERAEENMGCEDKMREEMHEAMMGFVACKINDSDRLNDYKKGLTKENRKMLGEYASFTAKARTHVKRNMKGFIMKTPSPEFPTRLIKEITKVVGCHAVVYGREVREEDLQVGLRLMLDNIPDDRLKLLRKLAEEPIRGFHTSELSSTLSLGAYTAKQQLEELLMLCLIYRELVGPPKGDKWRIVPEYRVVIQHFLDFDTNLLIRVNPGGYVQLGKKAFLYDKLLLYSATNVYSNNNSITITEEDKEDKIVCIYTTPETPSSIEKCSRCDEEKPYMSSYNEKVYCDNCLEALLEEEATKREFEKQKALDEQKTIAEDFETEPPKVVPALPDIPLTQEASAPADEKPIVGLFNPDKIKEDKKRYAIPEAT